MKKVIIVLMLFFTTTNMLIAKENKTVEFTNYENPEKCHHFAVEMSGLLAIWLNNSFEEEEADYDYFIQLCMETY